MNQSTGQRSEKTETSVMIREADLQKQIAYMKSILNERQYRCYFGTTAISVGCGGQVLVVRVSGLSINTVRKGIEEVKTLKGNLPNGRIRKQGGGRKSSSNLYPTIGETIEKIIDGETYGDPEKVIHWTTKSLMSIAEEPDRDYGIKVSHTVVAGKLEEMGYSKQLNQRMLQVGKSHPNRNAQFRLCKNSFCVC